MLDNIKNYLFDLPTKTYTFFANNVDSVLPQQQPAQLQQTPQKKDSLYSRFLALLLSYRHLILFSQSLSLSMFLLCLHDFFHISFQNRHLPNALFFIRYLTPLLACLFPIYVLITYREQVTNEMISAFPKSENIMKEVNQCFEGVNNFFSKQDIQVNSNDSIQADIENQENELKLE